MTAIGAKQSDRFRQELAGSGLSALNEVTREAAIEQLLDGKGRHETGGTMSWVRLHDRY